MADASSRVIDRVFGHVIGFLMPGFVVLLGAARVDGPIAVWFGLAASAPTLAGLAFVALAALTAGYMTTAIRFVVFERLRFGGRGPLVSGPPRLNEAARGAHHDTYEDLRASYYVHYLASANLAIAVLIGATLGLVLHQPAWPAVVGVAATAIGLSVVLAVAACDAIRRYDERRLRLLGTSDVAA